MNPVQVKEMGFAELMWMFKEYNEMNAPSQEGVTNEKIPSITMGDFMAGNF